MQITANGIALEVEQHGPHDGPALILIRGLGTQLIHWPDALVQGFAARGYRTVIFDNRDTGLSARWSDAGISADADDILAAIKVGRLPPAAYTLSDMAGDVIGLMDALDIVRADVFGISMGGAIAQILAIEHAARLRTAVIVMSAGAMKNPALLPQLLVRDMGRADFQRAWVQGHADWGSPGYPMPEADIAAEAGRAWDRGADAAGVNRQALAIAHAPDRRDALKRVQLPCLVFHGADDTLIPPDFGFEIATLIPDAALRIIPGMGHVITPALAPIIVDMTDRFLKS